MSEPVYGMPSPDWDYVTLKWAGTNLDGTVPTGTIILEFDGVGPFLDDSDTLPISIFRKTISAQILERTFVVKDVNDNDVSMTVGYAEVKVPVSNDPDIPSSNATYTFTENFSGGRRDISFVADLSSPGGAIWLNKIAPTSPNPGVPILAVYYSDFIELKDRVTELEDNGSPGGGGDNGESPELRVDSGFIQWKLPSQGSWTNLIATADLKGAPGDPGDPGGTGDPTTVDDGAIPQSKINDDTGWLSIALSGMVVAATPGASMWIGTQTEYDAIAVKSGTTAYFIKS